MLHGLSFGKLVSAEDLPLSLPSLWKHLIYLIKKHMRLPVYTWWPACWAVCWGLFVAKSLPCMHEYLVFPEEQYKWLAQRDSSLGSFMEQRGKIARRAYPAVFPALVRAIIGQQISSVAQDKIWIRLLDKVGEVTPDKLEAMEPQIYRSLGISSRKAKYIANAATQFSTGIIREPSLWLKTDEEICAELIQLPGVGLWTVEMLLIFTFRRPNILSYGDLAIRKGLCKLHNLEQLDKELFGHYRELYSPYGTLASIYLWELANPGIV